MRQAASWALVPALLALTVQAAAAPLPTLSPQGMIVPSQAIGPFRLGMTPGEVTAVRRHAPCEVVPSFARGKAARLETNCGGAYHTADLLQVGSSYTRLLSLFGAPDRVANSDLEGTRADWLHYTRFGISFRVIFGLYGYGFIQAIAVFKGTDPRGPRRPLPDPGPTPPGPEVPPGFGD